MSAKEVLRYIGLVLLSIILIVSLIAAVTATSARIFLDPAIYENAFEKSNAFETLAKSAIPQDSQQKLPSDELKKQGNQLIRNLLSYIKSESLNLNLTITIQPELIKSIITESVVKAKTCNPGDSPYQDGKLICRPEGVPTEILVNQALIEGGFSEKPLIVDLKNMLDSKGDIIDSIKSYISALNSLNIFSWILAIISLIAIFFLGSTYSSKMRWIGIPLIIAGILIIVIQGVAGAAVEDTSNSPQIAEVLKTVFLEIFAPFKSRMLIYSLAIIIIGILIFIGSFLIKYQKK